MELKSEISRLLSDGTGFSPTLAVVFISLAEEMEEVRSLFKSLGIAVFGSSSGNEFIDGDIETASIVALLMDPELANFQLVLEDASGESSFAAAERIGLRGASMFSNPAFLVISSGLMADGDAIIEGFHNAVGDSVDIIGGLASDDYKMVSTYVFTSDAVSYEGILALVLNNDKISIDGIAVGGWRPVGIEHVITRSETNRVWTIDNEPALHFIQRYSGLSAGELNGEFDMYLSNNFQLQLLREGRNPVMRAPMGYRQKDGSIVFAGSMPEGSKVRLCLLPGFEVIQQTLEEFAAFKKLKPMADALIMFSCAGRRLCLGPFISDEVQGVVGIWNSPMVGFFCYGEIGRVEGRKSEHHNMTCSLAVISEK